MGNVAIGGCVFRNVGIEQVDVNATDVCVPKASHDFTPRNTHPYRDPLAVRFPSGLYGQVTRISLAIFRVLNPVAVDGLGEIALPVQKTYRNEVGVLVAGGLAVIPCEHPQAAGIDRKALVKAVLRAEVGNRTVRGSRPPLGEIGIECFKRETITLDIG